MSMQFIVLVFALIAGAGAGFSWPRAYDAYQEKHAVYGTDIDHSLPWGPSACKSIAEAIMISSRMHTAGAPKSGVMKLAEQLMSGAESENVGQVIRELSMAWDAGNDPVAFYNKCAQDYWDYVKRKMQEKQS